MNLLLLNMCIIKLINTNLSLNYFKLFNTFQSTQLSWSGCKLLVYLMITADRKFGIERQFSNDLRGKWRMVSPTSRRWGCWHPSLEDWAAELLSCCWEYRKYNQYFRWRNVYNLYILGASCKNHQPTAELSGSDYFFCSTRSFGVLGWIDCKLNSTFP